MGHKNTITSLTKSADDSHFITGSLDKTAKACVPFFYLSFRSCTIFLYIFMIRLILFCLTVSAVGHEDIDSS